MSKIEVNAIEPQCGTNLTVGASGDTITFPTGTTIVNNGSQTGFGRTGTVDWDTTPKTATFSAVSGNGYFCNTSGGAFTVNLPAGSAGAIVSLADYAATWQTNNLTVSPNGTEKIGSANADVVLNTEGQSVTFVYVDSTQGWINTMDSTSNVRGNANLVATGGTITTCGNCKIHTFTGPGSFTVTNAAACAANNVVSYMVVAGGGGGVGSYGGGGGAGGFREYKSPVTPYTASPLDGNPGGTAVTVSAQAYAIAVGAGGFGTTYPTEAIPGNDSTFSSITSTGGGGGGIGAGPLTPRGPGRPGGSGGGAGGLGPGTRPGGTGNTPPVSPSQGNNGGDATAPGGGYSSAGGGGAGTAGTANPNAGSPTVGTAGGNGVTTSISANPVAYAGGGGGGAWANTGGAGGTGGGGAGGPSTSNPTFAQNGTTNTGGGGGGGRAGVGPSPDCGGANGGSGIVVIRYKFQ